MDQLPSMHILIRSVLFLAIVHLSCSTSNKLNESSSNNPRLIQSPETIGPQSYHAPTNQQRPTQFIEASQQVVAASPTYSRAAGLILPANNQVETNNFKESYYSHPTRYRLQQINGNVPHHAGQLFDPSTFGTSVAVSSDVTSPLQVNKTKILNQTTDLRNVHHDSNLEMALRQVNSDEGMFQPSPALIVPPDHSYDWSGQQTTVVDAEITQKSNNTNEQRSSETSTIATTTTTDQSNNILSHNLADYPDGSSGRPIGDTVGSYDPMSLVNGPTGTSSNYQSGSPVLGSTAETNATITVELPNHVFYEGPATAPPTGNYYFSSSEKLPNNGERASNAWWLLGFGHEYERASNLTRDDYRDYCSNSELLVSNKQRSLCRLHPKIMPIVARGLKMAIDECQFRFSTNRWNCSLVLQNSLPTTSSDSPHQSNQLFGDVMKQPNRERSFLNAIVAAGLAHAMTKACSQGELPEECSCDKKIKSKNNRGKIEWVACSDDIDYGARFSRDFTDQMDNDSDATSMINVHNYEVGRRVFKSATDITCTCQNGENGLCQTKRCWKHLGSFTDIGDELIKRYESATHVQHSSRDPHKLRPVRRGVRKPRRKDLVYIDESPDYCSPNIRLGVLGTQNRRCNSTSMGSDSCSLLCCGRGYQVIVEEVEEDCNCKFVWCCQVKCEKCRRQLTNDVCN